ncbi:MAG: AI-2E family transporter [Actinomycetota bacterium]
MSSPMPPRLPVAERLRRIGIGAWALIGIAIVVYITAFLLYRIRIIFPPLILATLIVFLLNPFVTHLERRGVNRILGTMLAYIVALGTIVLILVITVPYISRQIDNFAEEWPEFRAQTVESIDGFVDDINDRFGLDIDTTQVDCLLGADDIVGEDVPTHQRCDQVVEDFRELLGDQAGNFTEISRGVLEVLLILVIAPLIALYLLIDLPQLRRDVLNLIPEPHRDEFSDISGKVGRAVGGFLKGQLFVAFIVGALSAFGFWVIDLPFWLVIGAIAGLFNLVPLIGPFIGGGVGFLVGALSDGVGLGLQAAVVELLVQQLDNHVISPNVMRRTVQLHPTTVMLALLAGGAIAGFWGVFLGVPAVATVKLIANHIWTTRVLGAEPTPYARARPTPSEAVPPEEPEPD